MSRADIQNSRNKVRSRQDTTDIPAISNQTPKVQTFDAGNTRKFSMIFLSCTIFWFLVSVGLAIAFGVVYGTAAQSQSPSPPFLSPSPPFLSPSPPFLSPSPPSAPDSALMTSKICKSVCDDVSITKATHPLDCQFLTSDQTTTDALCDAGSPFGATQNASYGGITQTVFNVGGRFAYLYTNAGLVNRVKNGFSISNGTNTNMDNIIIYFSASGEEYVGLCAPNRFAFDNSALFAMLQMAPLLILTVMEQPADSYGVYPSPSECEGAWDNIIDGVKPEIRWQGAAGRNTRNYLVEVFDRVDRVLRGQTTGYDLSSVDAILIGYSVGAQMVSRSIESFPNMKFGDDQTFPKIKAGIMLNGGSLYCYAYATNSAGIPDQTVNHTWNCQADDFDPAYPLGCCPFATEPAYQCTRRDAKDHPFTVLIQAEDDFNASPESSLRYFTTMKNTGGRAGLIRLNGSFHGLRTFSPCVTNTFLGVIRSQVERAYPVKYDYNEKYVVEPTSYGTERVSKSAPYLLGTSDGRCLSVVPEPPNHDSEMTNNPLELVPCNSLAYVAFTYDDVSATDGRGFWVWNSKLQLQSMTSGLSGRYTQGPTCMGLDASKTHVVTTLCDENTTATWEIQGESSALKDRETKRCLSMNSNNRAVVSSCGESEVFFSFFPAGTPFALSAYFSDISAGQNVRNWQMPGDGITVVVGNQDGMPHAIFNLNQPLRRFEDGSSSYLDEHRFVSLASGTKWPMAIAMLGSIANFSIIRSIDTLARDVFPWWTQDESNPTYNIAMKHFLSFTSGMKSCSAGKLCTGKSSQGSLKEHLCKSDEDFVQCIERVYQFYSQNSKDFERDGVLTPPGDSWEYYGLNLDFAAAMVTQAMRRQYNWWGISDTMREFLGSLGFTRYGDCSYGYYGEWSIDTSACLSANALEYATFLNQLLRYNVSHWNTYPYWTQMATQQLIQLSELDWNGKYMNNGNLNNSFNSFEGHYAFGHYIMCYNTWNDRYMGYLSNACAQTSFQFDPGLYGFAGYISREHGYYAVLSVLWDNSYQNNYLDGFYQISDLPQHLMIGLFPYLDTHYAGQLSIFNRKAFREENSLDLYFTNLGNLYYNQYDYSMCCVDLDSNTVTLLPLMSQKETQAYITANNIELDVCYSGGLGAANSCRQDQKIFVI